MLLNIIWTSNQRYLNVIDVRWTLKQRCLLGNWPISLPWYFRSFTDANNDEEIDPYSVIDFTTTPSTSTLTSIPPRPNIDTSVSDSEDLYSTIDHQELTLSLHPPSSSTHPSASRIPSSASTTSSHQQIQQQYVSRVDQQDDGMIDPYSTVRVAFKI